MKSLKNQNLFYWGLVCLVFGSLGLWINADQFKGSTSATSKFTRTTGKIIASNVRFYRRRKRNMFREKEKPYYFDISYSYQVDGQTFSSNRISFDIPQSQSDATSAQAVVHRYTQGRSVAVFYLSDEPSFAVLELRNGRTKNVLLLNVALWLLGLGLVLAALIKNKMQAK